MNTSCSAHWLGEFTTPPQKKPTRKKRFTHTCKLGSHLDSQQSPNLTALKNKCPLVSCDAGVIITLQLNSLQNTFYLWLVTTHFPCSPAWAQPASWCQSEADLDRLLTRTSSRNKRKFHQSVTV